MSIKRTIAAAAIAAAAVGAVASDGTTSSAVELSPGQQALADLCRASRGDFYWTPYAIARCQGARSRGGEFQQERDLCTGSLQGEFVTVEEYLGKNNRWLWVCR